MERIRTASARFLVRKSNADKKDGFRGQRNSVIGINDLYARTNPRTVLVSVGRGTRMSHTTSRRALSILIVGTMVLAGFLVFVTAAPNAAARMSQSPSTPTTGVTGLPRIAENPSMAAVSAESRDIWKTKLDSGLKDAVDRGSNSLIDVVIYTQDMNSLTPLLNKFAVERLPEEFRGKDQRFSQRSLAHSEGIVSTTVTIPAYAVRDFAKLPAVLGMEKRLVPATADYTNLGLTS